MINPFETITVKLEELTQLLTDVAKKLDHLPSSPTTHFNVNQAAHYLDMAKPTLYTLTSRREIPHMKRGKKLYFNKTELDNWLQEHRKKTVKETQNG